MPKAAPCPRCSQAFLAQHYLSRQVPASSWPERRSTRTTWRTLLAEQAGHAVQLVTRPQGQRRAWLEMARKNAQLALAQRLSHASNQEARLAALQEALALPDAVQRIECFDISHTQGEATVASCVVYDRMECATRNTGATTSPASSPATITPRCARCSAALRASFARGRRRAGPDPDRRRQGQVDVAREVMAELGHERHLPHRRGQGRGAQARAGAADLRGREDAASGLRATIPACT